MPLVPGNSRGAISQNVREMILHGHPHAQAVAASLSNADRHPRAMGGLIPHRDAGGILPGVGGPAPGGNPLQNNLVQRYTSLPTEKLQELAGMLGGTPSGQIVRQVLNQKLIQGAAQQPAPTAQGLPGSTQPQPLQGAARGGLVAHRAFGGPASIPMSMATPSWARSEESAASHQMPGEGFLAGTTAGRADAIRTTAPGGAYVIPADVVAGLGEGNSLAGAKVAQLMFSTGPFGTPMIHGAHGRGPPSAPHMAMGAARGGTISPSGHVRGSGMILTLLPNGDYHIGHQSMTTRRAEGGGLPDHQPVMLSDGEFVVAPQSIVRKFGDLTRGHRAMDKWVIAERKKHIAKLKKLKPPVGAKAA